MEKETKNYKPPKFRKGDEVKTKYGTRAVVEKFIVIDGVYKYEVKYRNTGKIDVEKESDLKFYNFDVESGTKELVEVPESCPKCGTPWKITRFGAKEWHDCEKCGKKAEELVNSAGKTHLYDDLLSEFEEMIGTKDDDDDDFGGWIV